MKPPEKLLLPLEWDEDRSLIWDAEGEGILTEDDVRGETVIIPYKGEALVKATNNYDRLRSINAELVEACQDLIGIAETYIMQTYDRFGSTRRRIDKAEQALARATQEEK